MDVIKLRDWYRSRVGHTVRRTLQTYVHRFWPELKGERVLVLGYGVPYAQLWPKEAQVFAAMPGKMGVMHWPENDTPCSLLVWENELPFPDDYFDKVFIAHALEFAPDDQGTLAECYRVLAPKGRVLAMVPNRNGAWSRFETSPLGRGQPYSGRQLAKLFSKNGFTVHQTCYGLFMPPTHMAWVQRYADTFEKIGQRWRAPVGGVVFAEGQKDVYAGSAVRVSGRSRARRRLKPAFAGMPCWRR